MEHTSQRQRSSASLRARPQQQSKRREDGDGRAEHEPPGTRAPIQQDEDERTSEEHRSDTKPELHSLAMRVHATHSLTSVVIVRLARNVAAM